MSFMFFMSFAQHIVKCSCIDRPDNELCGLTALFLLLGITRGCVYALAILGLVSGYARNKRHNHVQQIRFTGSGPINCFQESSAMSISRLLRSSNLLMSVLFPWAFAFAIQSSDSTLVLVHAHDLFCAQHSFGPDGVGFLDAR